MFVFAAGNGGDYYDSCAADGYTNSIYTISAGSVDQNGQQADYDEKCSAKMVTTFSYNSDTFPTADDDWDPHNQIVSCRTDERALYKTHVPSGTANEILAFSSPYPIPIMGMVRQF